MEGPPARGSGLYPLRRPISATRQVRPLYPLPKFAPAVQWTGTVGQPPTDAGPTPEGRTNTWVTGRDGRCTRFLIETRLVRFQRHPPSFAGLADMDMHSPFKRDEAGSMPASRTKTGDSSSGTGSCILSMERRFEPGIPFECGSVVPWERTPGCEPGNWDSNPHRATITAALNRVGSVVK
jgi:hypothetical protein